MRPKITYFWSFLFKISRSGQIVNYKKPKMLNSTILTTVGRGSHNGVHKSKMWIFVSRNIYTFFNFEKNKIVFFQYFWQRPERAIFEFSQKSKNIIFSTPETRLKTKIPNSNERILRKKQKRSVLGMWGQKGKFRTVFGQNGQKVEKRLENFFCLSEF